MLPSIDDARRRARSGAPHLGAAPAPVPPGGRVPPHNLEAEEALLGSMMLSRDAIATAVEKVSVDDFYRPSHGHIYDAITALYGGGEPVDHVTVAEMLRRAGVLEAIGGESALVSIKANTPATSSAGRYAAIVEENALLRRLIGVAGEIAEIGYGLPDDVTAAVDTAESMVFDVAQRRTTDTIRPLKDLLVDSLDHLEALYDRGETITGVPTGYGELDEQLSGLQKSNLVIVGARPSMGKALALETPVLTSTGWTTMGDLEVGQTVIGGDGRPDTVTAIYDQGERDLYRVTFDDGASVECCDEHLWLTTTSSERSRGLGPTARPLSEIRHSLRRPDGNGANHAIPYVAPVHFAAAEDLPLDPYCLGLYIGDGDSCGGGRVRLSSADPEPRAAFHSLLPPCDEGIERIGTERSPTVAVRQRQRINQRSSMALALEQLGLLGRGAHDKFVPPAYLTASPAQRLALLQGLCDTDGYVTDPSGAGIEYVTVSRRLSQDVVFLVQSLGGRATSRIVGGSYYRINFSFPACGPVPVRLARKVAKWKGRERGRARSLTDVQPSRRAACRCITVSRGTYVVNDFIVTHNTAFALGMAAHAAMQGTSVLFFSLEMSHLEIAQRMLCAEARVDASRMRNGRLLETDWGKVSNAIGRLSEIPLYVDDNPNVTVMDIRAKARRLASRSQLGLVVVDYLQLMSGRSSAENRQVEVSEISRGMKILARELQVPVVALSQLSRNLEARADKRPVLADLRESGCMPADTRIWRADGTSVTLGELVLSQEQPLVHSLDNDWKMVPRRMTKVFPTGVRSVFRLTLASGVEVKATANHPFRKVGGWTRLDELEAGDFIAVPRRLPEPSGPPKEMWGDDELCLLAHLLGDGSIGPNGVKYATIDPANKAAVSDSARRLFGIEVAGKQQGRTWLLWFPSPYRLTHGKVHPVRGWLEPHGLWGSRSHDKFVPAAVMAQPSRQIAYFLRHLWATDGSIVVGRNGRGRVVTIRYATTSRRLADDVQALLLRLDIRSRVGRARKKGYRDLWHVTVSAAPNMERFLTLVGCHGERGDNVREALEVVRALVPNPNVDLVPDVSDQVRAALRTSGTTHRALAEGLGERYCGSYLIGTGSRERRWSRRRLAAAAEILQDGGLASLAASDVCWERVTRIEYAGEEPTFDATVEDTHNFVAQGIVAHNSLEQDADVVMFIYRDEVYNPESAERGTAEIIVAKHRNGPTGVANLAFVNTYARFANMARI